MRKISLSSMVAVIIIVNVFTFSNLSQTVQADTIVGRQQVISLPTAAGGASPTNALLWLPDDYASTSQTYPLIINLHGAGDAGTNINSLLNGFLLSRRIADGWNPEAVNPVDGQNYKFIVLSPQAPGWSYQQAQIKYMLPALEQNYRVDTSRIYVTGLSAGGSGAWTMVTDDPTNALSITAIAPIANAGIDNNQRANIPNAATNNIPVWSVVGDADGFLYASVDYTNVLNSANPPVPAKITTLPYVGHSAWIEAWDPFWRVDGMNMYEWMLQYKRGVAAPTNARPTVSLSAPANRATFAAPGNITLTANATDSDGTIDHVNFYNGSTLVGTATTSPYTLNLTNQPVGQYTFFARAYDNANANINSSTVRVTVLPQAGVSAPYGGVAWPILSKIEAENYDIGGQGIAYNDSNPIDVNRANWYRPYEGGDTELTLAEPGGWDYFLSWAEAGKWTKYTINVPATGVYSLQARVASNTAGKSFTVDIDGTTVATIAVPNTGDFQAFQTVTIPNISLTTGTHVMRVFDVSDGFSLNWITFVATGVTNALPVANPGPNQTITLPTNSVSLVGSGTDSDGTVVGYAWSKVSGSGDITTANTAGTAITGLTFGVSVFRLTVTDNLGATGFADLTVTVNSTTGGPVSTPYGGTARNIPGTIQAEDYDVGGEGVAYHDYTVANQGGRYRLGANESVDVESSNGATEGANAYNMSHTTDGEWVKYSVNVTTPGTYTLQTRVSAYANYTRSLVVDMDGTALATVSIPNTNGWQIWQTVTTPNITLTAGAHVLRLTMNTVSGTDPNAGFNVNYLTFSTSAPVNQVPVANAGSAQTITLPTNSVSLVGSGTDSDGTIASYAWSKVSGGVATITTPSIASTTITGLTAGPYVFRLTVTDNQGATGSADVNITVNSSTNIPPVANAGSDQTITLPTNSVTLSGSGTDSDGTISTYAWTKQSGGAATITSASSPTTTVTGLAAGTYFFLLTVTDNNGSSNADSVIIVVNSLTNQAPTVNAGPDQSITLPTSSVTLTAIATDPENNTMTYAWTKTSGPAGGSITSPSFLSTTVTGLSTAGTYVFSFIATDSNGASSLADTVSIVVNPTAGGPISTPYGGTARNIPGTIQAEDYDVGGEGVAYHDSTTVNSGNINRAGTIEAVDIENTLDAGGGTNLGWTTNGEWIKYSVNVLASGTYSLQTRVAAYATYTRSMQVDMDSTVVATVSIPNTNGWQTYQTVTTPNLNLTAGTHILKLTMNTGSSTDTTQGFNINYLTFTTSIPVNLPPIASAGNAQTITLPTNSVTLTGSGTDTDGTIASYAWSKQSGTGGSITTLASASTTVTGLTAGSYVFRLTVTDNQGATAFADVNVTVNPTGGPVSTPYGGTARNIPGTIQAEDYDVGGEGVAYHDYTVANQGGRYRLGANESVDVESSNGATEGANAYNLSHTTNGEWVKYTVNVVTAGTYTLQTRVSAYASYARSMTVDVDGNTLTTVTIPNTNGWQIWQTVTTPNLNLTAGAHVIKLTMNTVSGTDSNAGFNVNYFTLN